MASLEQQNADLRERIGESLLIHGSDVYEITHYFERMQELCAEYDRIDD